MSDAEDMMVRSASMINTSIIITFVALYFLPWFVGLYDPSIDVVGGKIILESLKNVGGAFLIIVAVFTFHVGTGWLIISTIFYGFEKVFLYINNSEGENNVP